MRNRCRPSWRSRAKNIPTIRVKTPSCGALEYVVTFLLTATIRSQRWRSLGYVQCRRFQMKHVLRHALKINARFRLFISQRRNVFDHVRRSSNGRFGDCVCSRHHLRRTPFEGVRLGCRPVVWPVSSGRSNPSSRCTADKARPRSPRDPIGTCVVFVQRKSKY